MYALKAPESKRQYPKRFKVFLDYLQIEGDLDTQAEKFLSKAKKDLKWAPEIYSHLLNYLKPPRGVSLWPQTDTKNLTS